MSQKSSLYRTIEILKRLNEGKKLSLLGLSLEYEVSERTIRRDFELIREIFGDFVGKEGGHYQAYKKLLLDEVLHATDLLTLANIVTLFGMTQKDELISENTKALIQKSMLVYDFKSRPFESIQNKEIMKKIEHAIKFRKTIRITYKTERYESQTNFNPYKILFLNENFYMVGLSPSKNQFEFRRISLIVNVEYKKTTFILESNIEKFIKTIQTPWASFGQEQRVLKIRVHKKIRRFFKLKKYLPSQKVVKTYENGDLLVEYSVSSYHEVTPLIIKWLPHIDILSPRNLRKTIKRELKEKIEALNRTISID